MPLMILKPDTLKQTIQFAFPISIILAIAKMIFYYGHFDIDIIEYISFDEVILYFLDEIVYIVILALFVIFVFTFLGPNQVETPDKFEKSNINTTGFFRFKRHLKRLWWFYLFYIVFVIITSVKGQYFLVYIVLIGPISFIVTALIQEIMIRYLQHYKTVNYTLANISFFIFSTIVLLTNLAKIEINRVESSYYHDSKFLFDNNNIIVINDTIKFVGLTNDYLLLYNTKERTSNVYKRDDINRMVFRKGYK